MSLSLYLIVEGVTDATLVSRILVHRFGAKQARAVTDLPEALQRWIDGYKWPHMGDISRGAVPVPRFFKLPDDRVVVIANGEGIAQMTRVASQDQIALDLRQVVPRAVGVIVDADGVAHPQRSAEAWEVLRPFLGEGVAAPASGVVQEGTVRAGLLVVPEPPGRTVDSVIDALGELSFPELRAEAMALVEGWRDRATGPAFKDLRKPAGTVKARLGVMCGLLKPMKPFSASLEDQDWVTPEALSLPAMRPLVDLLDALLAQGGEHA